MPYSCGMNAMVGWLRRFRVSVLQAWMAGVCGLMLGTGFLAEQGVFAGLEGWTGWIWGVAYVTGGAFGLVSGLKSLGRGELDVDVLMVLAALGAAYVGAPFEGAMLLFLFSVSNVLQMHALDRSRKAIEALMRLRPSEVLMRTEGGEWERVRVEGVAVGSVVRVKPGENLALDGEVVRGESAVDEASLTGESLPVLKRAGDAVFAGTLNTEGSLEVRVTRAESDSTLARIVKLVAEAREQKAASERFLEKAERVYATGVILVTLGMIVVPWKLMGEGFDVSFYRAMTLMVVASPCALILSTPAAFLSAIGGAARRGVLFKGGVHLERLAEADTVAFDKTGTLTRGKPALTEVVVGAGGPGEEAVLGMAAALEAHSEHPLARAVMAAARERGVAVEEAEGFVSVPGKGARGEVGGRRLVVGSPGWFEESGVKAEGELGAGLERLQGEGTGVVVLGEADAAGRPERMLAVFGVADGLRADAAEAVKRLRRLGMRRLVMLTGDHRAVAERIGREAGVDEVRSELLPEDKVAVIRELSRGGRVVMVGDGVNDAPALAGAHVGVAMGAAGTDVAMETADVVLMGDQLGALVYAVSLAKRSRRIVRQNLVFSLGVIAVLIGLTLTVGIPLPMGVVGHEGSTVLVCLNGLRLLRFRGV